MKKHVFMTLVASAVAASTAAAQTLNANATSNNGGSPNWGVFFDVSATSAITITGLTTASTAAANAGFSIEVFTRAGSGLGGGLGGVGGSPAGWTSQGTVSATQGATSSGISQQISLAGLTGGGISLLAGNTVGVALIFTGAGPRYFGTGSAPLQTFTDGTLTLVTGDARSAPFTNTGSFFSSRGLTGSLTYVPAPGAAGLLGLAGLVGTRRRR